MGLRTPVLLFYGVRKNGYLDSFIPRSQRVNAEFIIYNEILLRGSSERIEKSYSKTTLAPPIHCHKLAVYRSEWNQQEQFLEYVLSYTSLG